MIMSTPARSPRLISVVIPARDEGARLATTMRSVAGTRTGRTELEFVIVDDASSDCSTDGLDEVVAKLRRTRVVVRRSEERVGVPRARNVGARHASGDVLFITDAHVRFSRGWDEHVLENIRPNRILAATITDGAAFSATGCVLAVPFMGTYWNPVRPKPLDPVQIAACPGTALSRRLFDRLGGYDDGMLLYAAAEPEFSVRAWLSGARVVALPQVQVKHRFKTRVENKVFLAELRPFMVHNAVRFGMLYLPEEIILQMIRQHSMLFGEQARQGLRMVASSNVKELRDTLRSSLRHDFTWYVKRFGLKDQAGRDLLVG